MELIAIGFLLGVVVNLIIFMGGVIYDRSTFRDYGEHIPSVDDRNSNDNMSVCSDTENNRLDISATDSQKEEA